MDKLSLGDIKLALRDPRFTESLPESFKDDIVKWKKNPGCGCNVQFYKKIINEASDYLKKYFPNKDIDIINDINLNNNFSVINCSIHDLENIIKKTGPGRKQIAISRYEDQVTVVLNELE